MSIWTRFLLLLLFFALFFQGKVVYLTVYAFIIVYFGFRSLVRTTLRRLIVARDVTELRLFPGEGKACTVTVENTGWFPLSWLLIEERVDSEIQARSSYGFGISLKGRDAATVRVPVEAKRRGVYRMGPLTLQSGDPLGVERFTVRAGGEVEVLVYPRIHPIGALGLPSSLVSGSHRAPRRPIVDPSRVRGVRDYVPGDPIRHVHWRATAHTGEIMVKTFESVKHFDVAVVLDLEHERYRSWNVSHMSELAIEVAASLVSAAADRRQAFGIYALARSERIGGSPVVRTGVRKGDVHLRHCLESLARIRMGERGAGLEHAVTDMARELTRDTTLFIVTPDMSPSASIAVARLIRTGFRVCLVEVRDEGREQPLPRGLSYARIGHRGDIARFGDDNPVRRGVL